LVARSGLNLNVTSLTRDAAQFEEIPKQVAKFGIFDTCTVFMRGQCLVRGISGTTSRASLDLSWRRRFVDSVGKPGHHSPMLAQTVFGSNPPSVATRTPIWRTSSVRRRRLPASCPQSASNTASRSWAASAPRSRKSSKPIAQVIARPNETRIGRLPNEDAQSLVFDDTSLFDWDKFSGYDRAEGGVRANLGAQYTLTGANGFSADALIGQSFHLAGVNSFQPGDIANVGRDSGSKASAPTMWAALRVSPSSNLTVFARGRFDEDDFSMKRLEAGPPSISTRSSLSRNLPLRQLCAPTRTRLRERARRLHGRRSVGHHAQLARFEFSRARSRSVDKLNQKIEQRLRTVRFLRQGLGYADECTVFTLAYSIAPKSIAVTAGEKGGRYKP
jgi:LPS-assembly protein